MFPGCCSGGGGFGLPKHLRQAARCLLSLARSHDDESPRARRRRPVPQPRLHDERRAARPGPGRRGRGVEGPRQTRGHAHHAAHADVEARTFDTGAEADIWHLPRVEYPLKPIPILDFYGALKGRLLGPRSTFWEIRPFSVVDQLAKGRSRIANRRWRNTRRCRGGWLAACVGGKRTGLWCAWRNGCRNQGLTFANSAHVVFLKAPRPRAKR